MLGVYIASEPALDTDREKSRDGQTVLKCSGFGRAWPGRLCFLHRSPLPKGQPLGTRTLEAFRESPALPRH